jgi:hypothetical protein
MSPRIIHLPLSGRDRRHYVRELRAAEQAHRDRPAKVEEAYRAAHAVACHEWNVRQFIGGPAGQQRCRNGPLIAIERSSYSRVNRIAQPLHERGVAQATSRRCQAPAQS